MLIGEDQEILRYAQQKRDRDGLPGNMLLETVRKMTLEKRRGPEAVAIGQQVRLVGDHRPLGESAESNDATSAGAAAASEGTVSSSEHMLKPP